MADSNRSNEPLAEIELLPIPSLDFEKEGTGGPIRDDEPIQPPQFPIPGGEPAAAEPGPRPRVQGS
jgi:hypothetical protein